MERRLPRQGCFFWGRAGDGASPGMLKSNGAELRGLLRRAQPSEPCGGTVVPVLQMPTLAAVRGMGGGGGGEGTLGQASAKAGILGGVGAEGS